MSERVRITLDVTASSLDEVDGAVADLERALAPLMGERLLHEILSVEDSNWEVIR